MENKIFVSVIVPVYKVEPYLDRCLDSIVNQTLKNLEIILVDDGSPDNCPAMCDLWAKRDNRIKVIHKKNAGLGFARNSGLDIAKGEYVIFCDSDDRVDARMYATLYAATERGKYDVVYSGFNVELPNGKWIKTNNYSKTHTFENISDDKIALSFIGETDITEGHRYIMSCNVAMYRRLLLEEHNIRQMSEREVLSEDMVFQLQVALNARNVKFIPGCYYYYYQNGASLTHVFKESKLWAAFRIREIMNEIMGESGTNKRIIDGEFYSRIRSLLTQMICGNKFPFSKKIMLARELCEKIRSVKLDTTMILGRTWKYGYPYKLLISNKPLAVVLFAYFDKYINRENLFWWRKS